MLFNHNCEKIQFNASYLASRLAPEKPFAEIKHHNRLPGVFLPLLNYNKMCEYRKFGVYPSFRTFFGGAFSFPSENFKKNPFFVNGFSFFSIPGDCGWLYFDKQQAGFDDKLFFDTLIKLKNFPLDGWHRDTPLTFTHNLIYSKNFKHFSISNNYVQPNNMDLGYRGEHLNYLVRPLTRGADVFSSRRLASAMSGTILFPTSQYNENPVGGSLIRFFESGLDLYWATRFFRPTENSSFMEVPGILNFNSSFSTSLKKTAASADYLETSFLKIGDFYKASAFNESVTRFASSFGLYLKLTRKGFKSKDFKLESYKNSLSRTFADLKKFDPFKFDQISSPEFLEEFRAVLSNPRRLSAVRRRKFYLLRNKGFKRFKARFNESLYTYLKNKSSFISLASLKGAYLAVRRARKIDRFFYKAVSKNNVKPWAKPWLLSVKNKSKLSRKRVYIRKPAAFKLKSRRPRKGRSLPNLFSAISKSTSIFNLSEQSLNSSWCHHYRMARRHKSRFGRGRKFYKGFWSVSWHKTVATRRRK